MIFMITTHSMLKQIEEKERNWTHKRGIPKMTRQISWFRTNKSKVTTMTITIMMSLVILLLTIMTDV